MKKKLLVLGESYMNLQMKTNPPQKDEKVTLGSEYGFHPYGDGAATAISAAKLGGECVFCTKLGDDMYGKRLREYYKSCGLHLSDKEFVKDVQTGMSVTLYNDITNGHTYLSKGANLNFTKKDVEDAFSYSPDMFIFPQEDILSQQKELETIATAPVPQPSVTDEEASVDVSLDDVEDFSETIMFSNDITMEMTMAKKLEKNLAFLAAEMANERNIDLIVEYNKYTSKFPLHKLDGIKILVISEEMLYEASGITPSGIDKMLRALIPLAAKIKAKYYIVQQGNDTSFVYDGKYYDIVTIPPLLKAKAKQECEHMHGTYIGALAVRFLETRDVIDACKYASVASILTRSNFGSLDHVPSQTEIEEFTAE